MRLYAMPHSFPHLTALSVLGSNYPLFFYQVCASTRCTGVHGRYLIYAYVWSKTSPQRTTALKNGQTTWKSLNFSQFLRTSGSKVIIQSNPSSSTRNMIDQMAKIHRNCLNFLYFHRPKVVLKLNYDLGAFRRLSWK